MKGKGILVGFGIFFSIIASSQKINPEHPDLSPSNFKLDSLPNSEINIPIQINLKPIYDLAEKSVDTLFTSTKYPDEWVQEGCSIRYKYIFRRSPLSMKANGTSLNLGFTGFYKIIGSTRLCVNGTVISPWTPPCRCGFGNEGERKVNVSFTNSLNLLSDYKVQLLVIRNEPEPIDKCAICFWKEDITKQVMTGLKNELDAAKKDIDKRYGIVNLRSRFQNLWEQLTKVYNLNGLGWLKINPQKFHVNNIFAANDSLNVFLGLSAKPVISFEKPVEKTSPVSNLGSFIRNPGFSIFLDAILNYDSLSFILNQQVKGMEFNFNKLFIKKKFIIDSCKIYGAGNEKLVIKMNFSGTNEGVVYLLGKAVYNKESRRIEVTDVDFDIKSKNILLTSADWLFNKKITKEIMKKAKFDLGSYLDMAGNAINSQLNKEWVKGVRSYGNISEINLIGIYPMQQYLIIRSNCTGHLSVKVDSINFSL